MFTAGMFEQLGNGSSIAALHGAGGPARPPRSAMVMITKNDGGIIGL
jgi:hypothetical protein